MEQVASQLIKLSHVSLAQARNAYSALMMVPGFDQLRFCSLLTPYKKLWSESTPKYAAFWCMKDCLASMANASLDRSSIPLVRDRLILLWRFFHLARSVDLSRLFRTVASVGDQHYVLMQRKGWRKPGWHEVIALDNVDMSPWHVLLLYVRLTAHQGREGGPCSFPCFRLSLRCPVTAWGV